jgi:pre-mRNA-splicing factor ATP-dependent RNA helicase DHX38/PRP16
MRIGSVCRREMLSRYKLTEFTAELGSVFYSVKEKNFDDRGLRRQADKEFSKRAELETEIAKQREAYVPPVSPFSFAKVPTSHRTARQAAEDALAVKTASGSKAKVIVPGTPRHSGIGAGSRVAQTPRRRVGI